MITNPSGTDSKLRSTIDLLYEHESFDLRKLFSPEHGIRGNAEAGEEVGNTVDEKTGLPVVSLYRDDRKLRPEMIDDIDAILFDIQDVVGAAGLDVLNEDPPEDSPLMELDSVGITPHVAWYSEESKIELRQNVARDIRRVLRGEKPTAIVNTDLEK
ncbi:exo-beta-N-acetylmuramidase NamZ domain-containing protein [Halomicrococcus sp. NG-SE-24]|uniref:exo-beta-N-acetylmuramidase NamZ domain-containing protein n=1 Tax=Halomicrococcus sp. NG-SE-24 TaxID=3436928 RepID=UPI003D971CF3